MLACLRIINYANKVPGHCGGPRRHQNWGWRHAPILLQGELDGECQCLRACDGHRGDAFDGEHFLQTAIALTSEMIFLRIIENRRGKV